MAKKTKPVEEPKLGSDEGEEGAGEKATAPKNSKDAVNVYDANGAFVRTYSLEVHGENYEELAEGFVSKVAGRVIK